MVCSECQAKIQPSVYSLSTTKEPIVEEIPVKPFPVDRFAPAYLSVDQFEADKIKAREILPLPIVPSVPSSAVNLHIITEIFRQCKTIIDFAHLSRFDELFSEMATFMFGSGLH